MEVIVGKKNIVIFFLIVSSSLFASGLDKTLGLSGCWQSIKNNKNLIYFQGSHCVFIAEDNHNVFQIMDYKDGVLTLRIWANKYPCKVKVIGQKLYFEMFDKHQEFHKLSSIPDVVLLKPFPLGKKSNLKSEEIEEIQKEMKRRLKLDQEVRTNPKKEKDANKVDADNQVYIKKILKAIGWLDSKRFGSATTEAAFYIIQHSGNISLMKTAVSELKKEIDINKRFKGVYAFAYDRLQILLGKKQKYGTQYGYLNGKKVLFPLEDEKKVEEFRKEMGLKPLYKKLESEKKGGNKIDIMKHW